jgi:hypothetical protein
MYTFSSKLKLFIHQWLWSFRDGYGFLTAPKIFKKLKNYLLLKAMVGMGS